MQDAAQHRDSRPQLLRAASALRFDMRLRSYYTSSEAASLGGKKCHLCYLLPGLTLPPLLLTPRLNASARRFSVQLGGSRGPPSPTPHRARPLRAVMMRALPRRDDGEAVVRPTSCHGR